jgi:hypothetical protein
VIPYLSYDLTCHTTLPAIRQGFRCAAVRQHVMQKLAIPPDSTPATVARLVKQSVHMKDYFITKDFIRHMRDQTMDRGWRNDKNDAVSVKMAVCSVFLKCSNR